MDSYITKAIDEFLKEMMKLIKNMARNHILKVDDACIKLCKRDNIIFQWLVAKLLFLSKRARLDIQPTITFLTTRVRIQDKDDWKKIRRVLSYLDVTINSIKIHLNANGLNVIHWWVDASYGTYIDLKGQTGAMISVGKGCVKSA